MLSGIDSFLSVHAMRQTVRQREREREKRERVVIFLFSFCFVCVLCNGFLLLIH
jgi:hypothetical protein